MSDRVAVETPSLYHYLAEPYRAVAEHLAFVGAIPALGMAHAGEGQGRHVLVIPGLMSDDLSTRLMRKTIDLAGYRSHGWRLGRNIGPTRAAIEGIVRRLEDLANRQGGPIPVVGWSLGGLFARDLAMLRPHLVDRVITMGSPVNTIHKRQSSGAEVHDLFEAKHLPSYSLDQWRTHHENPVQPITSIFSKSDGIVQWKTACVDDGPRAENVEVFGSHFGLGANATVVHVVLNRLAVSVDDWQPFRAEPLIAQLFPASCPLAA